MHVSSLHLCKKYYLRRHVCETGIKLSCLLKCNYRYRQYLLNNLQCWWYSYSKINSTHSTDSCTSPWLSELHYAYRCSMLLNLQLQVRGHLWKGHRDRGDVVLWLSDILWTRRRSQFNSLNCCSIPSRGVWEVANQWFSLLMFLSLPFHSQ